MEYNNKTQYYKGVPIKLIVYTEKHFARLNAKRFILGNPQAHQNIWIPNCYLEPNGTLKNGVNIDFIFKKAYCQKKFYYANININPMLW
jgi:hypothetical protein